VSKKLESAHMWNFPSDVYLKFSFTLRVQTTIWEVAEQNLMRAYIF